MRYMIDPSADAVWDAIVTEVTADGVFTTEPETDEDWMVLRRHAVTLIEATDLLLMEGRRVAAEGSRSELPGVDLEPEEIEALLEAMEQITQGQGDLTFARLHQGTHLDRGQRRDSEALARVVPERRVSPLSHIRREREAKRLLLKRQGKGRERAHLGR